MNTLELKSCHIFIYRAGNVVNLRSALVAANAVDPDDVAKFSLPEQTWSLQGTAPANPARRGVSTRSFSAQMVLHAMDVSIREPSPMPSSTWARRK